MGGDSRASACRFQIMIRARLTLPTSVLGGPMCSIWGMRFVISSVAISLLSGLGLCTCLLARYRYSPHELINIDLPNT